jgi:hypothetical protein
LAAFAAFAVLAAACASTPDEPYAGMTERELAYVIPDSARWGPGNPCADGVDCAGSVTPELIADLQWVEISRIVVVDGTLGDDRTIKVEPSVDRTLRGDGIAEGRVFRAWGQDAEWMVEAIDAGHEVWVGWGEDPLAYFSYSLAISDAGQFAGIGFGAGRYVTRPLAAALAQSGAVSARTYLEDLIIEP